MASLATKHETKTKSFYLLLLLDNCFHPNHNPNPDPLFCFSTGQIFTFRGTQRATRVSRTCASPPTWSGCLTSFSTTGGLWPQLHWPQFSSASDHLHLLPLALFFCPVIKFCRHNNVQSICGTLKANGSTVDLTLSSPLSWYISLKCHRIEAGSWQAWSTTPVWSWNKSSFLKKKQNILSSIPHTTAGFEYIGSWIGGAIHRLCCQTCPMLSSIKTAFPFSETPTRI